MMIPIALEKTISAMAAESPIPFADRSMIYAGVVIEKSRVWDYCQRIHDQMIEGSWMCSLHFGGMR